jgi:hypothetical protein
MDQVVTKVARNVLFLPSESQEKSVVKIRTTIANKTMRCQAN